MILFQDLVEKWAEIMWPACWQGALAILVAWALVKGFGARMPAAWRPWPWRLAFLKLAVALVPLAGIALPVLQPAPTPSIKAVEQTSDFETRPDIFVPKASNAPAESDEATDFIAPPVLKSIRPDHAEWAAETRSGDFAYQPPQFRLLGLYLLFSVWGLGLLREAFLLVRGAREVARIRAEAVPLEDETANSIVRELSSSLGLRREPELLESAEVGPLLLGCWRSAIVLPSEMLATLDPEQMRLVLAHELAHLRRRDLQWALGTAFVSLLFWFHPLVWLARRELRPSTEEACDAMTLRTTGASPSVYGKLLLDVAAGFGFKTSPALAVGVAEDAAALGERLRALALARLKPSRTKRIVLFACAVVALAGIVPWRLTARAQSKNVQPSTKKRHLVKELTGQVLTVEGKPAANVPVYFLRDYENPTVVATSTRTDVNGNYRLDVPASWSENPKKLPPPRGNVIAVAGVQGVATAGWDAWRGKPNQLRLPRLAQLVVNLRDEKGRPVSGQSVRLWKIGSGNMWRSVLPFKILNFYRGTSDAKGQLVLNSLPLGERVQLELGDVTLRSNDWWTTDLRGRRWAPLVKRGIVQVNEPVSRVTLHLNSSAQLSGIVRYKKSRKLASGTTVLANLTHVRNGGKLEANWDSYTARAQARSNGRFSMAGLRPGMYRLWAEILISPERGKGMTPIGTAEIKAGQDTTVNLTLPFTGSPRNITHALIDGIVKSARTDKPVPRQWLGLKDSKGFYRYTYSNGKGRFRFQVPPGEQYVWVHGNSVSPPPGFDLPAKKDYRFSLGAGQAYYMEVRLPDKAVTKPLRGVVLDENKKPVEGATVTVEAWGRQGVSGQQVTSVRTGVDGRFSVGLKYIEQRVRLWANTDDLQTLKPAFGRGGDDVVLYVQPNAGVSIRGTVRERNKGPIPQGASVELIGFSPSGGRPVAKTQIQPDGTFRFINQRVGREYMVRLEAPDYEHATEFVQETKSGEVAQVEFKVARLTASLRGRVLTADGKPADGVQVRGGAGKMVTTGPQGYFKLPKVAPGLVSLMVYRGTNSDNIWGPFPVKSNQPNLVMRLENRMRWSSSKAREAVWANLVGKAASEVEVAAWINSKPLTLASGRGKVTLLHFWNASFPGAQPQPAVEELYQQYKAVGLQVIGIQVPGEPDLSQSKFSPQELEAQLLRTTELSGLTYPVALDKSDTARTSSREWRSLGKTELKYQRAPIVIINREGKIVFAGWDLRKVTEVLADNLG